MKFSLIIPTRNRAALLEHALASALAQRFDDYEIIVSNNDCTDDTDAVVRRHDDPRIKYVRTGAAMSMVDHWNFALGHASGDWVLVLCDDDALMPDSLEYLDRLASRHPGLEIIRYEAATYYYDDGLAADGNALKYRRPPPDRVSITSSARRLRSAFRSLDTELPKLLNCAVRRQLLGRIGERHGRVCHEWAPDYSAAILLLGNTDRYATVHNPLMLWGKNLKSYGSGSQVNPQHFLNFFLEFPEFDGTFPYSPYPKLCTLLTNSQYDTIYRARELLGASAAHLEVDPFLFRRKLLADIDVYIREGYDEYREHRDTVQRDLERMSTLARTGLAWTTVVTQFGRSYETLTGRRRRSRRVRGTDGGFRNIAEAAEFFSKSLR